MKHRFSPSSLQFIATAARQKKPEWLKKNQEEYEAVLVQPMKELIQTVSQALQSEAPDYRFPSRQFARIRRGSDTSKGPFRDWVGVLVTRDSKSRFEDLPNLYFHISPEDVFSAGGLYMPSADQTKHIRKWIDQDPSHLEALFKDRAFTKIYSELGTERMLKTKPRDYPTDHPRFDWLRLSAWYVWKPIPKKILYSKHLPEVLIEHWRQVLKLNRVLDQFTQSWPSPRRAEPVFSSWNEANPRPLDWDE